MFKFRSAKIDEYKDVLQFYDDVTDDLQNAKYTPGWIKRVYPTEEFLQESLRNGDLFVGTIDDKIIGAMVLNHDTAAGYEKIDWQITADKEEVIVLHAFGIAAKYRRRGFGKKMVKQALDLAKSNGMKAMRLDVLAPNLPPQKLYLDLGFEYRGSLELYYEDTGLTDYKMYEYIF